MCMGLANGYIKKDLALQALDQCVINLNCFDMCKLMEYMLLKRRMLSNQRRKNLKLFDIKLTNTALRGIHKGFYGFVIAEDIEEARKLTVAYLKNMQNREGLEYTIFEHKDSFFHLLKKIKIIIMEMCYSYRHMNNL